MLFLTVSLLEGQGVCLVGMGWWGGLNTLASTAYPKNLIESAAHPTSSTQAASQDTQPNTTCTTGGGGNAAGGITAVSFMKWAVYLSFAVHLVLIGV